MALTINHNPMAMNTARSLNQHFGRLSTSTQRLSSGLRINSSADDAAGLAIRELQRSDIRTLRQGARNANDAISMLQTMDGGLSIIDEKLIRMKELAEQAATGTYNSTQRLMINDEFQAMKSEIDRIANATDFNNIKLLSLDRSTKVKEDVKLSSWIGGVDGKVDYPIDMNLEILNHDAIMYPCDELIIRKSSDIQLHSGDENIYNWRAYASGKINNDNIELKYSATTMQWSILSQTSPGEAFEHYTISYDNNQRLSVYGYSDATKTVQTSYFSLWSSYLNTRPVELNQDTSINVDFFNGWRLTDGLDKYPNASIVNIDEVKNVGKILTDFYIDLDGDKSSDIVQHLSMDDPMGTGSIHNYWMFNFGLDVKYTTKIHFGTGNNSAEDYYSIDTKDCTAKGLGIDKAVIDTQDAAQKNLTTLNSAIVKKDNARAYFGSMQNRLENTISNLNIQAENLQASESRISDTDVGIEMTEMVKNQILSQAATAMLAQANSIPKMALQVIGG